MAYVATSILMALGSCRRMISASLGEGVVQPGGPGPCGHRLVERGWPPAHGRRQGPEGLGWTSSGLERPRGAVLANEELGAGGQLLPPGGRGVGRGLLALGAELLDVLGVGLDEAASCCCCSAVLRTRRRLQAGGRTPFTRCRWTASSSSWVGRRSRAMGTTSPKARSREGRMPERKSASGCAHTHACRVPPLARPAPSSEAVLQV